jgi:hypothetical protein
MPKKPTNDVLKARVEAAELLGFGDDPQRLCIADRLRVDLVVSLRAAIDHASASLLDDGSNSSDLARLVNAVEHLTKLLPERQLAAPESQRDDPRQVMWRIYMEMRERGEVPPEGHFRHRIAELEAKVAELEAALADGAVPVGAASPPQPGSAPALPDVATLVERMPAPAGNVVPLARNPSSPAPAPAAYDYSKWIEPDGSIRTTPRGPGRYWGPV